MFSTKIKLPQINGLLMTYTVLTVCCIIADYFKLVEFYIVRPNNIFHLGLVDARKIYIALAGVVVIGLVIVLTLAILRNYKRLIDFVYFPRIAGIDWVVIIFFLAITFFRLPIPDRSFDTVNYHLFLQTSGFENNVTYNFFPANLQTFTFPLGDRLFYVFRALLGYRGGTLLSTLVLILLYFQVKDLLILSINAQRVLKHRVLLLSLSALFVLSTEYILATIGIYMIDSLMLPFLLELYRIAIGSKVAPQFALVYSSVIAGLSIAIKLTSIPFCVLLFSVILYRYYRGLTIKTVIISFLFFLSPFAVYMTYNFTQTHNPIFPLYNSYFGSPIPSAGYIDTDFGPRSTFEALVWPIYIFFQPARTNQIPYYSGRLGIGFLVAIAYAGFGFLRKSKNYLLMGLLALSLMYMWTLTSGVIRFGLFLEVISGILIVDIICGLLNIDLRLFSLRLKAIRILSTFQSNWRRYYKIQPRFAAVIYKLDFQSLLIRSLATLILMAALAQGMYAYYLSTITNIVDWSLRPSPWNDVQTYLQNIKMIGADYLPMQSSGNGNNLSEIVDRIDVWIVSPSDITSGWAKLLKSNIPILGLNTSGANRATFDMWLNLEKSSNLRSKNIYTISLQPPDKLSKELNQYGFEIVAVYEIRPTFTYFPIELIRVMLK